MKTVLDKLRDGGIGHAQRPKTKFANPAPKGYRDANLIVKLPGGMLAEVRIHLKASWLLRTTGITTTR
ncbi:hypothetical protein [Muricoccus pecuniae]|uniref:Uncharacterized protein n=1 Tax=Muricoccus pecuniae TaxID=693023 RepID=A0A840Y9W9_9PROT|nr:hypothetical protein [Roseomonas pecuniae]MBB5693157.1 hypothetical protein [Roseomonas pecuniae]